MNYLVTGGAGFIGNHLALRLLAEGHEVVVVDNMNSYYDPSLKEARLARLGDRAEVHRIDLADFEALENIFQTHHFDAVAHLAAQAGVRYSIEDPFTYARSNYLGSLNIFELAKRHQVAQVVCASTSSVYGLNEKMPFTEEDRVDEPISVYAASKRAVELLAYTYCHLFQMNITMLRFFTVYGPWGRPDMAFFLFTKALLNDEPITLFNGGEMKRDFTYVDDIVEGFVRALQQPQEHYNVFNLGNGTPVHLRDFLKVIEREVGKKATIIEKPMQPGDVVETYADVSKARERLGFTAKVSIEEGIKKFVQWYTEYYSVPK